MAAARPGPANWPFTHFTTLEPRTILPVSQTPLQPFFPTFPHPRDRLDSVCPFILRGRICPSICTNVPFLSGYCPEILKSLAIYKITSFGSHVPGLAKPKREPWCHFPLPLLTRRRLSSIRTAPHKLDSSCRPLYKNSHSRAICILQLEQHSPHP